jgi:protein TonB
MSAWVKNLLVICGAALTVALLAYFAYTMTANRSTKLHRAPKISLIPATPPPPPPPKEEKKPEPPKEQKEVKLEQALPKDAPPAPPSAELKMEGPAGDGPSAFQAGKVTREDIGRTGPAGGGVASMVNPFANYASALKGELQRYLARNKELRQRAYRVELQLWVGRDGSVSRHELVGSTGDSELDGLIRQAIAGMSAFTQPPPDRMPQPIRLRLVTAGR